MKHDMRLVTKIVKNQYTFSIIPIEEVEKG